MRNFNQNDINKYNSPKAQEQQTKKKEGNKIRTANSYGIEQRMEPKKK